MERTLSDKDVDAIANRIVRLVAERLAEPALPRDPPPPVPPAQPERPLSPKLTFSAKELSAELGVSVPTIYRLDARGLLKSLPYLRTKIYPRREVERFPDASWMRRR